MKINKEIKLLKNLVEIPSPSGYEKKSSEFIRKELLQYLPKTKIEIDFHNNVIATIIGRDKKRTIVIDAHQDILGFLINNVDKEGYISLVSIGGHDISLLRGRKVLIITSKNGILKGVIGSKPIHLIENETDEIPNNTTDVTLDIGIRRRKKVLSYISIGDPVVIKPEFDKLIEDYYTGSGFDDKAGCFMLIEIIKNIVKQKRKPACNLKFVFSVQEEIGCKGAKEIAYRYKPDLFVGVDVTFSTDQPDVDERVTGRCILGEGIGIYKGINIHQQSVALLNSIAKNSKTKIQYLTTAGAGGTNAKSVANMCGGLKIVDFGIPLRNMHTSVEIINMKDIKEGIKLLTKFLIDKKLSKIIKK